jgi:transcriptional regulator with XRE-family HTH domain
LTTALCSGKIITGSGNMREYLVEQRRKMNLSQKQVAKQLGISQQFLSLIEAKKRDPHLKVMIKFENLYGVPMRILFIDIFKNERR